MQKIFVYVDAVPGEISGLFTVKVSEDNQFIMTDVFLLDQEATSGGCELSVDGQTEFLAKLAEEENYEAIEDLKGWWHSHANMGVFWSGTDETTQVKEYRPEYLVSLVVNKKREMKGRLTIYNPICIEMDLEPSIAWAEYAEKEALIAEVKAKVKEPEKKVAVITRQGVGIPNYHGYSFQGITEKFPPSNWAECPSQLAMACHEKGCLGEAGKCTKYLEAAAKSEEKGETKGKKNKKQESIHRLSDEEVSKLGVVIMEKDTFEGMTIEELEAFKEAEEIMQQPPKSMADEIDEEYEQFLHGGWG
jgi:hypothetical protein